MSALVLVRTGPGVTIQDGGRHGWARWGVTAAGPMDALAHQTAHLAVGNSRQAAGFEVSLGGLELAVEGGPLDVAVVAPGFSVRLDARELPDRVRLCLSPGERLTVRAGASGTWGYVAPAGRMALPPVLGSLATHVRSGLGGLEGRALADGDRVGLVETRAGLGGPERLVAPWLERRAGPIRVLLGPQEDHFTEAQVADFLARAWEISPRSDRMATALSGEALVPAFGHDIVSDAVAAGAIQVPGSGQPFVLMADRQPTGGYPKIATVIRADLGRLAQMRAGERVRFSVVTVAEAVAAWRAIVDAMAAGVAGEAVIRRDFSAEFLLSTNLISRWGW